MRSPKLGIIFGFLLIAFASLFLRFLVQPYPIFDAFHDDSRMVQGAYDIMHSGWLGNWDIYTLTKGSGYPLFLVLSHYVGIQPTVLVHVLILLAGFIVVREITFQGISWPIALGFYALIAFFPAFFGRSISRIYRDGLLSAIAFLIAAVILIIWRYAALDRTKEQIFWHRIRIPVLFGVVGLLIGVFFITKVNWHFLVIPLFTLGGLFLYKSIKNKKQSARGLIATSVLLIGVTAVGALLPIAAVSLRNAKTYNFVGVEDWSQGGFPAAMDSLMSIQDPNRPEYVDVTKKMREDAYLVSPTLLKLKPYLELEDGQGWRAQSCSQLGICNESALWFAWDFRDAMAAAGLAANESEFQKNLNQIATDIQDACKSEQLKCGLPGTAPGLRSLSQISPRLIVDAMGHGANHFISISAGDHDRPQVSTSNATAIEMWRQVVDFGNITPSSTSWNPGSRNVDGVISALDTAYQFIWPAMLIAGIAGYFIKSPRGAVYGRGRQILGLSFLFAVIVFTFQLALLEADGALILINGGNLYLLPAYPFLLVSVIIGISQLLNASKQRSSDLGLPATE